jgi:hypothetical protein
MHTYMHTHTPGRVQQNARHAHIRTHTHTLRSNDGIVWTELYDQPTVLTPVNEMSAFSVSSTKSYSYIGLVVPQLAGTDQIANCLNFFQWNVYGLEVTLNSHVGYCTDHDAPHNFITY